MKLLARTLLALIVLMSGCKKDEPELDCSRGPDCTVPESIDTGIMVAGSVPSLSWNTDAPAENRVHAYGFSFGPELLAINLDECGGAELNMLGETVSPGNQTGIVASTHLETIGNVEIAVWEVQDSLFEVDDWIVDYQLSSGDTIWDSTRVYWTSNYRHYGSHSVFTGLDSYEYLAKFDAGMPITDTAAVWRSGIFQVRKDGHQTVWNSTYTHNGAAYDYRQGGSNQWEYWPSLERGYAAIRIPDGSRWRYGWVELEPRDECELIVHSWALQY